MRFAVTRDAGRFDFEGVLRDGAGAGSFRFSPNARYVEETKALGFSDVDADRQMALAIHDVSLGIAREMKSANPGISIRTSCSRSAFTASHENSLPAYDLPV